MNLRKTRTARQLEKLEVREDPEHGPRACHATPPGQKKGKQRASKTIHATSMRSTTIRSQNPSTTNWSRRATAGEAASTGGLDDGGMQV